MKVDRRVSYLVTTKSLRGVRLESYWFTNENDAQRMYELYCEQGIFSEVMISEVYGRRHTPKGPDMRLKENRQR